MECERPMGAPREGRGVGSAAGLPTGESSANGRAPHIPGPGAPPLATRVPAGRAQCHALLPMLLVGRPLEWWGGFGEAGVGDRGSLCGVLRHYLRGVQRPFRWGWFGTARAERVAL